MSEVQKNTWKELAQSELFEGWHRWVSFSCIWIWSSTGALLSTRSDVAHNLVDIFAISNGVILASITFALLVMLLVSKHISSIIGSLNLVRTISIISSAGSAVAGVGVIANNFYLFLIGMICGGMALAPIKISFGEVYSMLNLKRGLISMGYSLISSMIVMMLVVEAPQTFHAILFFVASLPVSGLLFKGVKLITPEMKKEKKSAGTIQFSGSLLLLPAIVALSFGFMEGVQYAFGQVRDAASITSSQIAIFLVGVLLLVSAYKMNKRYGAGQIYAIAIIAVVAGLLIASTQTAPLWVSFFFHVFGFNLFYFFMVVYWGDLSWRTGMPIVRIYTIGYFTFQEMNLLGTVLGSRASYVPLENYVVLVAFSIILILFAIALLLYGNDHSSLRQWLIADSATLEKGDEIPLACSKISAEYSLTPREQEVLALLARGRNALYISQALHISADTSKTHIKNIYRKLDVHDRQDVIDLIEGLC